ncbi:unnamed protein product [Triticum turgidum subsp. durum]|uniref:G protein alpha subunit n=1 Tax=Triticum turgidum subsp. durum TaxID=4567 RepID=A0A9R1SAP6_TRITD|nr:unnamed protein product [Triticum turgidum subsp. durum]
MATPQRLLRSPEPSTACSPTSTPSFAPRSPRHCAPHHHGNDATVRYNQLLFEDKTPNRMMETKELFDWVLRQRCLEKTSFMLFLNKFDIFERKIQKVPLTMCEWFKDYEPIAPGKGMWNMPTSECLHPCHCYHIRNLFVKKFVEVYFKSSKHDRVDRVFKIYKMMALDRKLLKKTFRLIDESMRRSKEGNGSVIDHSVLKFEWNFSH